MLAQQVADAGPRRQPQRRRVDVVGALRRVDVVVRMQHVVAAALVAHAARARGWRSPRWRSCWSTCRRRPGSRRRRTARAAGRRSGRRRRGDDGAGALGSSTPRSALAWAAAFLTKAERAHQLRHGRERLAGDREVLDRARRVHTPVGGGRDAPRAEEVAFRRESEDVMAGSLWWGQRFWAAIGRGICRIAS